MNNRLAALEKASSVHSPSEAHNAEEIKIEDMSDEDKGAASEVEAHQASVIELLQAEIAQLKKEHHKLKQTFAEEREETRKLKTHLETAQKKNKELTKTIDAIKAKNQTTRQQIKAAKEEMKNQMEEEMKKRDTLLKEKNAHLEEEVKKKDTLLKEKNAHLVQHLEALKEAQTTIESLKAEQALEIARRKGHIPSESNPRKRRLLESPRAKSRPKTKVTTRTGKSPLTTKGETSSV
jgi:uncharacterized protein (DUF3084 family)